MQRRDVAGFRAELQEAVPNGSRSAEVFEILPKRSPFPPNIDRGNLGSFEILLSDLKSATGFQPVVEVLAGWKPTPLIPRTILSSQALGRRLSNWQVPMGTQRVVAEYVHEFHLLFAENRAASVSDRIRRRIGSRCLTVGARCFVSRSAIVALSASDFCNHCNCFSLKKCCSNIFHNRSWRSPVVFEYSRATYQVSGTLEESEKHHANLMQESSGHFFQPMGTAASEIAG